MSATQKEKYDCRFVKMGGHVEIYDTETGEVIRTLEWYNYNYNSTGIDGYCYVYEAAASMVEGMNYVYNKHVRAMYTSGQIRKSS